MVVQSVMRAWLISRQQGPSYKQQLPQFLTKGMIDPRSKPKQRLALHDDVEDDALINVDKRNDVVPLRRGTSTGLPGDDGFWSNHLFWKGIVFGVLAVVFIKTIFEVQTPFGIDWYVF